MNRTLVTSGSILDNLSSVFIRKKNCVILILTFWINLLSFLPASSEEGLWIPMFLEKYNIGKMQEEGLRLSAEDIYSVNQACLKDAIVIFGNGCTGELISSEGLVLTNHHCGFGSIQSHSSVGNDYISEGYWAMNREEELPNPGLKVTFLIRMEDVTSRVLESVNNDMNEATRDSIIQEHISLIREESVLNTSYKALVKPFYYGNEFYLFIYQEYNDVRLVGAPPNGIGNYGEDLDNWVWPRHTGDFSLFRIYADSNNNPAAYSPENKPFKSRKFLTIYTGGIKENDFTMVMGYPGTTNEYIVSDEIGYILETSMPKKVALREERLGIIDRYIKDNDTLRIMYANKYRNISNAWKKWQGVIIGLERTDALERKIEIEENFALWAASDPELTRKYGKVLPGLKALNNQVSRYSLVYEYSSENVMAPEIIDFALDCNAFVASSMTMGKKEKEAALDAFLNSVNVFFKNYHKPLDEEVFATMLKYYRQDIESEFHPHFFNTVDKKFKGNFDSFTHDLYKRSVFADKQAIISLLVQFPSNSDKVNNAIQKDPVMMVFRDYSDIYSRKVIPDYDDINGKRQVLYRTYIMGLREMMQDKIFYPDANFTMRIAYGKVEGYLPADGIEYQYATTLTGIMEKFRKDSVIYNVPGKLIDLYERNDYGRWARPDGQMPVCFIASNHTSGGNSGSPVLNGNGQLIGINFDRNWEGTMSDIYYDVSICRNISVDIRYILFIIDKYASASYLIEEMDIQPEETDRLFSDTFF